MLLRAFGDSPHAPTLQPARALRTCLGLLCLLCGALAVPREVAAQETPYFVTYSHHLEEPGNLEIELNSIYGVQKAGNDYIAQWVEFEYGAKAWWTTEFYLDWQGTFNDSALFTGFRWENRFRPLMREHWINPVLYVEYENTTAADKTMIEVVGFDNQADYGIPNSQAQMDHRHELETKLILSSDYKGWNISENFIAEKNLGPRSLGVWLCRRRQPPLAARRHPGILQFLPRKFSAGRRGLWRLGNFMEFYASWHVPLRGACACLAIAQRRHISRFAWIRAQLQQPSVHPALERVLRD